ncbi:MAG: hypothetical protein IJM60_07380 [Bacteroidales bacterium]|nr:hypothetical protein [Bacteroidales bacterium]
MDKRSASHLLLLLAVAVAALLPAGCSKVKDIRLTSFGIESFSPRGFRSADAVLAVGIDNPSFAFTVTDLSGTVKYKGEALGTFTADTVSVDRKCVKVYDVPCKAVLSESVSLLRLLSLVGDGNLEGFTADVEARVHLRKGVSKMLRFNDLDLNEYSQ